MDEELDYLWETLGLEITDGLWPERDKIHPTLCPGIQAYLPFMDEEYWSDTPDKHVKIYDPHEWAQLKD